MRIENLKSLRLLLIVPHFKVFIKDQVNIIKPYVKEVTILMPIPMFSHMVLKVPYLERHYRFLR
jgi:hypothetical protein